MAILWVLSMALQDPFPEEPEPLPTGGGCVTCFQSIIIRNTTIEARSLARSGRSAEALEKFCEAIRMTGTYASPAVAVGAVNAAMAAGRLKPFVQSLPDRSQVLGNVLIHLRALRERGKEDLFGLLNLIADSGRADKLGLPWDRNEGRPGQMELLLEMVDLAASLGPSILAPLERKAMEDPALKPWVLFVIAGTRTDRAREIIRANPSPLDHRLERMVRSDPRPRSFTFGALREARTRRAINEAILLASAKLGSSPPDDLVRERTAAVRTWGLAILAMASALVVVFVIRWR